MKKIQMRGWTLLLLLLLLAGGGYLLWGVADRARGLRDYAEALEIAGVERAEEPAQADGYAAALCGISLDALREANGEVVAWLDLPGTSLAYPLVHTQNNSYYLNHTWKGEKSAVGAVFLEQTCSPDFDAFHTIVYGHRMRDGSMFGLLKHYQEQDFWQEHPSIYLVTDNAVCRYDIFAAREAEVTGIVYRLDITESGLEEDFLQDCIANSVISTGIAPNASDRILTLSTCTQRGYDKRWVVHGVLAEVYEKPSGGR